MILRAFRVRANSWLIKRNFRWLVSLQFLPGILILAASISISLFDFGKPGLLPVLQEQRPIWLDMPGNRQAAVDMALRECVAAQLASKALPSVFEARLVTWGEAVKYLPASSQPPDRYSLKDTFWLVILQGEWEKPGIPGGADPARTPMVFNQCIMLVDIYNGERTILSN